MSTPILTTKLYVPRPRPNVVLRPRLIERLNEGLQRKLTLISAPAGFGKTTLLACWLRQNDEGATMNDEGSEAPLRRSSLIAHRFKLAWLSLDEGENDPARFLAYLVAAVQTIAPTAGAGVMRALQSPQPPQMHLVIATREDPQLPLARLRARGQLSELRAADLRFSRAEAAAFLNQVMGLKLSAESIAALEARPEGWIAGLQLAALSMQGLKDTAALSPSSTVLEELERANLFTDC